MDVGALLARCEPLTPHLHALTARDRVALTIATCGVGFIPVVPATWGSALGVGIYLLIGMGVGQFHGRAVILGWNIPPLSVAHLSVLLISVAVTSVAGVWASSRTEKVLRQKDPRAVVIDEIAGQFVTFLFVPFAATIWAVAAGFVLFRAFDILKPYPAQRFESLKSGLGIMADDLVAGLYAAMVLWLLSSVFSSL